MNIGLFFGSFNPVHLGHLSIAEFILKRANLDNIWFVVSPQSPFKAKEGLIPFYYRYEMIKLEAGKNPNVLPCDVEQQLAQPSYTTVTIEFLEKTRPEHKFSLIIGSDNLENFHLWKDYKEIINLHKVYVYPRSQKTVEIPSRLKRQKVNLDNIKIIDDAPIFNISSTEVRNIIENNGDLSKMVSPEVEQYIRSHGLYKINSSS